MKALTITDIKARIETQQTTISKLQATETQLRAEHAALMARKAEAIGKGDVDGAAALIMTIKTAESKLEAINEVLEAESARQAVSDEDIAAAMNAVTDKANASFNVLHVEYQKAKAALLDVYERYNAIIVKTKGEHAELQRYLSSRAFFCGNIRDDLGVKALPAIPDDDELYELKTAKGV